MSDQTFDPEDTSFDDFMNSLPALPAPEVDVDQAEFDALITELAQDSPVVGDLETTQPEIDPQEFENWLNSFEPASVDMDL